ncbi:unnamed protein product, partial [Nesidiocoris tenuis]
MFDLVFMFFLFLVGVSCVLYYVPPRRAKTPHSLRPSALLTPVHGHHRHKTLLPTTPTLPPPPPPPPLHQNSKPPHSALPLHSYVLCCSRPPHIPPQPHHNEERKAPDAGQNAQRKARIRRRRRKRRRIAGTCLICKITLVFVEKPLRGKKQPHLCLLHQQGDALTLRPVALGNIGGGSGRCRGKAGEERHQSRSRDSRQSSCSSTSRLIRRCRPILVVDCLRIPRISLNPSNKFEGSGPKATKTQPQLHLQRGRISRVEIQEGTNRYQALTKVQEERRECFTHKNLLFLDTGSQENFKILQGSDGMFFSCPLTRHCLGRLSPFFSDEGLFGRIPIRKQWASRFYLEIRARLLYVDFPRENSQDVKFEFSKAGEVETRVCPIRMEIRNHLALPTYRFTVGITCASKFAGTFKNLRDSPRIFRRRDSLAISSPPAAVLAALIRTFPIFSPRILGAGIPCRRIPGPHILGLSRWHTPQVTTLCRTTELLKYCINLWLEKTDHFRRIPAIPAKQCPKVKGSNVKLSKKRNRRVVKPLPTEKDFIHMRKTVCRGSSGLLRVRQQSGKRRRFGYMRKRIFFLIFLTEEAYRPDSGPVCQFEFRFHREFNFEIDYEFEFLFHCEFDFEFDYEFEILFQCEFDFELDCEFECRFH